MLLLGQRDAGDVDVLELREIERHVAPAAADVEDLQAGLEIELGRDQPQLVLLRLLQALVVVEEVGAGVLHALVEEQLVEVVAEVVVVRDVLLRLADRIGLLEALQPQRHLAQHLLHRVRGERQAVDGKQRQEIPERRVLEAQAAVHVGFAGVELGIEEQLAIERAVGDPHRHVGAAGLAREDVRLPIRVDHLQGAGAHERLEHMRQGKHGHLSQSDGADSGRP